MDSIEKHWKRGRWYAVGDWELCITETTMRGFRVAARPRIDKIAETDVKSLAAEEVKKPTNPVGDAM